MLQTVDSLEPIELERKGRFVKTLFSAALRVQFPDSFYARFLSKEQYKNHIMLTIETNNKAVGALCCEIGELQAMPALKDLSLTEDDTTVIGCYISAIAIVPNFRGRGIGSKAMDQLFKVLNEDKLQQETGNEDLSTYIVQQHENEIQSIYLHVWIKNKRALKFYKKLGFEILKVFEKFYRKSTLKPPAAFLLRRNLGH